ncbi:diphthamide biosynthesis protein [Metarhizium album ARSEF 1941]|uniref:2-(3-amino-3-carboxypropyl)histidine synthase subunit 2 n=1 Tax=Metarhizium album (strain ARSEF 1941) TaxID=1081103 RepID=A0A0B2WND6_METAS|nr:diphthamide biosynthesis protein [Metarhizium album ARSEF 1941]KHN95468.1 diphthamide biosynthesis protein [Metarhizium album ARSEF 1941]
MASELTAAPVLSTPDDGMLRQAPAAKSTLSDDELRSRYEIGRTAREVRERGWRRVALQFPDHMLVDAPRIAQLLEAQLPADGGARRVHVLADTSYSACCVDEVAAEHVDAEAVVHYGRACLSPTSRLPVVHVFTRRSLDRAAVVASFRAAFADRAAAVVVTADVTYQEHVAGVVDALRAAGYANVRGTSLAAGADGDDAAIPNRRIEGPAMTRDALGSHALFHLSDPPASLLLTLHTRFASLHVLSTDEAEAAAAAAAVDNPTARAAGLLRRRFARVLSLASAGVVGILVNTLSVSNYLSSIDLLRRKIALAGKKSYTVVVGKLNPAKLANFAEIEGWVVVGCWESGLVEEDAGYWRPVVTPFEMELALVSAEERTWGADWWGGIERLEQPVEPVEAAALQHLAPAEEPAEEGGVEAQESPPPLFDLRTGRLVGRSRPMQLALPIHRRPGRDGSTGAVARRVVGELASVNGVASPGAEYLRSQRTWQGLGTDFDQEASTAMEQGRGGVARGYRVGEDESRH